MATTLARQTPQKKAGKLRSGAINLFASAKADLEQANVILEAAVASDIEKAAALQAQVKDGQDEISSNAKIAARLADLLS